MNKATLLHLAEERGISYEEGNCSPDEEDRYGAVLRDHSSQRPRGSVTSPDPEVFAAAKIEAQASVMQQMTSEGLGGEPGSGSSKLNPAASDFIPEDDSEYYQTGYHDYSPYAMMPPFAPVPYIINPFYNYYYQYYQSQEEQQQEQ